MFYVYAHINPIKKEVFYVGKGTRNRAYSLLRRNQFWNNTVRKYGYEVLILVDGLTEKQSLEVEKQYIAKYKLRKEGGSLVNLTKGGRGGNTFNEYNIENVRKLCRESKLGSKNPNYGKSTWIKGKKQSDHVKQAISRANSGRKMKPEQYKNQLEILKRGRETKLKNAFQVACPVTGKIWKNRVECCKDLNISISCFKGRIYKKKLKYIKPCLLAQ